MGYRSDVGIVIGFLNKQDAFKWASIVALSDDDERTLVTAYNELTCSQIDNGFVVFSAHFVQYKWYPSYPQAMAHHKLMELAVQYDGCWRFARVGEEVDDNEEYDEMPDDFDKFVTLSEYVRDMVSIQRALDMFSPSPEQVIAHEQLNPTGLTKQEDNDA
jgi:hypothetical protein